MAMDLTVKGGVGFGKLTQIADTKIVRGIPGVTGAFTRLRKLVYTAAGTAHSLTVLRVIGKTRANGAAAINQKFITLLVDPGPASNGIGNSDRVAIKHAADGVTRFYILDGAAGWDSGNKQIKLSANLAVAVTDRDQVFMFGVETDTDPYTGEAHPIFRGVASVTSTYSDDIVGLVQSNHSDEPLLVISDNATAAGTLDQTNAAYTQA